MLSIFLSDHWHIFLCPGRGRVAARQMAGRQARGMNYVDENGDDL
jgi:hypothetical protein